jgi:hypothetical protein
MRFFRAKEKDVRHDLLHEMYLMRGLQLLTEYFKFLVEGNQSLPDWNKIISESEEPEVEKTGDEIALDVIQRAGLKVKQVNQ